MSEITVREAARRLRIPERSVRALCQAGTLPARRQDTARGPVWLVQAGAVKAYRPRGRGRPRKAAAK